MRRSFRVHRADETRREGGLVTYLPVFLLAEVRLHATQHHHTSISFLFNHHGSCSPCIPYYTHVTFPFLSTANKQRSNIHCPPSRTFSLVSLGGVTREKALFVDRKSDPRVEVASELRVVIIIIVETSEGGTTIHTTFIYRILVNVSHILSEALHQGEFWCISAVFASCPETGRSLEGRWADGCSSEDLRTFRERQTSIRW